jgi:hypothetical protein
MFTIQLSHHHFHYCSPSDVNDMVVSHHILKNPHQTGFFLISVLKHNIINKLKNITMSTLKIAIQNQDV